MSENTKVYPEILKVQLAYDDGWKEAAGHKVAIQGIDFSFVPNNINNTEIIVSSLDCGVKFTTIKLNFMDVFLSDTKTGTLQMFAEKAEIVSRIIDKNGKDFVIKLIEKHKQSYEDKFGKMPPVELFDMSDVPEEVREVLNESL